MLLDLWNGMALGQQIFACIAIPATLILIVMIILMLVGLGDHDTDVDGGADADADADTDADGDSDGGDVADGGLSLFTSRGIVAMLAIMGWSGVILLDKSLGLFWVVGVLISLALGFLTLVLVALAMRGISRLQSSGNIDINNTIGKVAQVYLTIPAAGKSAGKINITIQERLTEFSAITANAEPIKTGSYIRVVAISEGGVLVVEPLSEHKEK